MLIGNTKQMMDHIYKGGTFSLNKQGQLETQSGAAKCLQSFADAFRKLSTSGQAHIANRTSRLGNAMANLVAHDNGLPNLAQAPLPQGEVHPTGKLALGRMDVVKELACFPPQKREAVKLALLVAHEERLADNPGMSLADVRRHIAQDVKSALARMDVDKQLANFPPESRELVGVALRSTLKKRLNNDPDMSISDMRKHIQQDVKCMTGNPIFAQHLSHIGKPATQEQLADFASHLKENFSTAFMKPTQQKLIKNNGIHADYLKDAVRGSLEGINGQPPQQDDLSGQLINFIPSKELRGFVSMLASQAGGEATIINELSFKETAWGSPKGTDLMSGLDNSRILPRVAHHKTAITVTENAVDVMVTLHLNHDLLTLNGVEFKESEIPMGRTQFQATFSIPCNQTFHSGELPEFTVSMKMQPHGEAD